MSDFSHPDFFYVNEAGLLVMTAPNKATTTAGSTNTRSELRQMFRGTNTRISTHDPKNNFALKANRYSRNFADIGGQLEATLAVLHVSKNAKFPDKKPAFSVVVGQIHADKDQGIINKGKGFGWGNEPIKIYYKKWPDHDTGSVFWTYERNLEKDNPDRRDIAYPVWGNTWENPDDPGSDGIALGELFNYNINVHDNIMYLTFRTADPANTRSIYRTTSMRTARSTRRTTRKATRAMRCTSRPAPITSAAQMTMRRSGTRLAAAPATGQRTKPTATMCPLPSGVLL